MKKITLPTVKRGRRSAEVEATYQTEIADFCEAIKELDCRLDFRVSARGWCYILEEYGLDKGDFGKAESLINKCRKDGTLPLDICAEDDARQALNLDNASAADAPLSVEEETDSHLRYISEARERAIKNAGIFYEPPGFWHDQPTYIEMLVEKVDLKELFKPVCERFRVPIANASGWADINSRAAMMERFAEMEAAGKQCVLLFAGDHDPAGLRISDCLRSNLAELTKATGWSPENLIIDRFGLNADFIEANRLTWIDGLETGSGKRLDDPKHPHHQHDYVQDYIRQFGARKCEANALVTRPEAGRKLCLDAITKYIDPDAPDEYESAVAEARAEVRRLVLERLAEAEGDE